MNDERLWTPAGRLISGTDGSGRPLKSTRRDTYRLSFLIEIPLNFRLSLLRTEGPHRYLCSIIFAEIRKNYRTTS